MMTHPEPGLTKASPFHYPCANAFENPLDEEIEAGCLVVVTTMI